MARWSWSVDEKWEGLHFKRGREGWIFRSPISWTFGLGPHRHYLVSEAQKDALARVLCRPNNWGGFAILMIVGLLGVAPLVVVVSWFPALVKLAITGTWHVYLMGIFMALWFQGIMNIYLWLKIRSTLAGATRTAE